MIFETELIFGHQNSLLFYTFDKINANVPMLRWGTKSGKFPVEIVAPNVYLSGKNYFRVSPPKTWCTKLVL